MIPYYETDCEDIPKLTLTPKNVLPILKCSWCYKSGKNKGSQCTSPACKYKIGTYCNKHYKSVLKKGNKETQTQKRCLAILKSGKNKGNLCNCNVKEEVNIARDMLNHILH